MKKTKEKGIENVKQENGINEFFYGKIKRVIKWAQKIELKVILVKQKSF